MRGFVERGSRGHSYDLCIRGEENLRRLTRLLDKLNHSLVRKVYMPRDREGKLFDLAPGGDPWGRLVHEYLQGFPITFCSWYAEPPYTLLLLGWRVWDDGDVVRNRVLLFEMRDKIKSAIRFI